MLKEFTYDPKLKRYRVKDGSGKGQFISKKAFLESTSRYIEDQKQQLQSLASEKLTIKEFQSKAAKILKELHTSQAILGAKGIENMNSENFLILARRLKQQYYTGIDKETGRKFGLRHLSKDIKNGLSEAQLKDRLRKYGEMSKISYWEQVEHRTKEHPFAVRTLGVAEHCPDCTRYASMGIQPRSLLPLPKENCECGSQCKCSIRFLSFEEVFEQLTAKI